MTDKHENTKADLALLLPWYVNGTLDDESTRLLEDALNHDEGLQHQYTLALEDQASVIELADAEDIPVAMSERFKVVLDQHIDAAQTVSEAPREQSIFRRLLGNLFPTQGYGYVIIAAALIITLQAGLLVKNLSPARYQTATGQDLTTGDIKFLVQFSPLAPVSAVLQFLKANNGTIVEGPTADGLFILQFKSTDKKDTDRLEREMSAPDSVFILVLPSSK